MSKQKVVLKKKSKQKLASNQRVALHAVQKQLQFLNLKEWLMVIGFTFGASLLRIPMQAFPSVEPITFFAILAGWLFGKKKGFISGAGAAYASNFFMFGGQGPWSLFQALGWGVAGFLGGFLRNIKPEKSYIKFWLKSIVPVLLITILATLVFEISVNLGSLFMFPYSVFTLFLTALPFLLVHTVSNIIFSIFLPLARKIVYEKGGFNEKELCNTIISRISNSSKFSWLLPRRKASEQ